jgi:hypothetical protein
MGSEKSADQAWDFLSSWFWDIDEGGAASGRVGPLLFPGGIHQ